MSETNEGTTMMDDRDTMTLLAHALVERRAHEDPWHELAMGVLTREQVMAMRRDLEPRDRLEHKLALFEPPTTEVGDRILDELLRLHASPAAEPTPSEPKEDEQDDRVVPLRAKARRATRRGWITRALVGASAVAAAVLLTWLLQPAPQGPPHLPSFVLELDDGWSGEMRGAEGVVDPTDRCEQRYHHEGSLSVRLHPSEPLVEGLSVAAFAQPESGEGRWIPPRQLAPMVSDQGVVSIEQPVTELGLSPGIWALTFYVVRRSEQPELAALRALEPGAHPGVTVVRGSVCIVE